MTTALHLYAKMLLAVARRVTLPSLLVTEGRLSEQVFRGGKVVLDSVRLEASEGDFQPDAIVIVGSERRAIEFKVSHAVDQEKRAKVEIAGCPMVEIDLSSLRWRKLDRAELDDQILHRAPRHWIHHPDRDEAAQRLSERVRLEAARKGARLRWHIRDRPQTRDIDRTWVARIMGDLQAAELDHFIDVKSQLGHWFTVPPRLWQAGLLHALVYVPGITFTPGAEIPIRAEWPDERNLVSVLPAWMLRDDMANYPNKALAAAGYSRETFGSAHQAAVDYLFELSTEKRVVVWRRDEHRFHLDTELHAQLHHRHGLEMTVRTICEAAGHPDPADLSARWMRRYNVAGRSPWDVAGGGGQAYRDLEARIVAILDMTRSYRDAPVVEDLCGLPLGKWRDELLRRREEKEAAKQEQLVHDHSMRRKNFETSARRTLGKEAEEWLASSVLGGLPIAAWASQSDDCYWKALDEVEAAEAARQRLARNAEVAEALRLRLTSTANDRFRDPRRAQLFLNSAHPSLSGRRPIEACGTEAELRSVLMLLPKG